MTVDGQWWEMLVISASHQGGRLDVRVGAVPLPILVVLLCNAFVAFLNWYKASQITA